MAKKAVSKNKPSEKSGEEPKPPKLTDKQRAFIEHYLACGFNATEAARRAGYEGNDFTLAVVGSENLRKPYVREVIDARLNELKMGADEVLMRLAEQARGAQSEFYRCDYGEKVYVDMVAIIRAGKAHLIKSISRDAATEKVTKVEFYDAQAALEKLGRHHKLFTDKVEHSGNVTVSAEDMPEDELLSIAKSG